MEGGRIHSPGKMLYRKVHINKGHGECADGILAKISRNHIEIVSGEELIVFSNFHIQNICCDLAETNRHDEKGNESPAEVQMMASGSSAAVYQGLPDGAEPSVPETAAGENVWEIRFPHESEPEQYVNGTREDLVDGRTKQLEEEHDASHPKCLPSPLIPSGVRGNAKPRTVSNLNDWKGKKRQKRKRKAQKNRVRKTPSGKYRNWCLKHSLLKRHG